MRKRTPERQKIYERAIELIIAGNSNKQISDMLGINVRLVEDYRYSLPPEVTAHLTGKSEKIVRPGFWQEWDETTRKILECCGKL